MIFYIHFGKLLYFCIPFVEHNKDQKNFWSASKDYNLSEPSWKKHSIRFFQMKKFWNQTGF